VLLTVQSCDPAARLNFCALGQSVTADVILNWYSFRPVAELGLWCPGHIIRMVIHKRNHEFKFTIIYSVYFDLDQKFKIC